MKSLVHFAKFIIGIDKPHSQLTDRELRLLQSYAPKDGIIVEIGCYEGKTTAALAQGGTNGKRVYSVDPFFRGRLPVCYSEQIARIHCRRQGLKNVELIKGLSHDVAPEFDLEIDLLFVDADHRYEAVKQDWKDWSGKVKKGGLIAFHDCRIAPNSPEYLGSHKFYDDDLRRMTRIEELDGVDALAIFRVL